MKETPNNSGSVSEKMEKDEKIKSARTRILGRNDEGRDGYQAAFVILSTTRSDRLPRSSVCFPRSAPPPRLLIQLKPCKKDIVRFNVLTHPIV